MEIANDCGFNLGPVRCEAEFEDLLDLRIKTGTKEQDEGES
jgi:hypothetical protein